jgi:hypothetical protein
MFLKVEYSDEESGKGDGVLKNNRDGCEKEIKC